MWQLTYTRSFQSRSSWEVNCTGIDNHILYNQEKTYKKANFSTNKLVLVEKKNIKPKY